MITMAKLVKCKVCGAEIAKSAKVCPKCGAKQKKVPAVLTAVVIVVVIILIAAIGSSGSGKDQPQSVSNPNSTQSEGVQQETKQPEKDVFGAGEPVSLNDVVVTLNSVTESEGSQLSKPADGNVFVLCEFTIENNSDKDLSISSVICFEAYVDDYSTSMSVAATISSDKSQLDGAVAAGKKMNGVIGYEVPEDWSDFEVRFTPDFWSQKDIIFQYKK